MGKSNTRLMWEYNMGKEVIMKKNEGKDLRVIIQDTNPIKGIFASK